MKYKVGDIIIWEVPSLAQVSLIHIADNIYDFGIVLGVGSYSQAVMTTLRKNDLIFPHHISHYYIKKYEI